MAANTTICLASCSALSLYLGTDDYYSNGQWYSAKLTEFPAMGAQYNPFDFGVCRENQIRLNIEDVSLELVALQANFLNSVWVVKYIITSDEFQVNYIDDPLGGYLTDPVNALPVSEVDVQTSQQLTTTCIGWRRESGICILTLTDLGYQQWQELYPRDVYHSGVGLPEILEQDHGKPIPIIVGHGVKIDCALISKRENGSLIGFDYNFLNPASWWVQSYLGYGWSVAGNGKATATALPFDLGIFYLAPIPKITVKADTAYRIRLNYICESGYFFVSIGSTKSNIYTASRGIIDVTLITINNANFVIGCNWNTKGVIFGFPGIEIRKQTPWRYLVCERQAHTNYWIDAVYMSKSIANNSMYRTRGCVNTLPRTDVDDLVSYTFGDTEKDYIALDFYIKPINASGQFYDIAVDITAQSDGVNAALECKRLLLDHSLSIDNETFEQAAQFCDDKMIALDWAYGARGEQVTLITLLNDVLMTCWSKLWVSSIGEFQILPDLELSPRIVLDEGKGDLLEIFGVESTVPPKTIKVNYQPDVSNPDSLKMSLTKTIQDGYGEVTYDLRMVRNFATADHFLSYIYQRHLDAQVINGTMLNQFVRPNQLVGIISPQIATTIDDQPWLVNSISWPSPVEMNVEFLIAKSNRFTYLPSVRPVGPGDYDIDYSNTVPDPPSVAITQGSDNTDNNGSYFCSVILTATVSRPEFCKQVYFKLERESDKSLRLLLPDPLSDDHLQWQVVFGSLVPGEKYMTMVWCENYAGLLSLQAIRWFIAVADTSIVNYNPANFTAVAQTTHNYLSWTMPSVNMHYAVLLRHNDPLGDLTSYVEMARLEARVNTYIDNAVIDGEIYYYMIYFVTRSGALTNYALDSAERVLDAPTGLSGSAASAHNRLTWNQVDPIAYSITIEKKVGEGAYSVDATVGAGTTIYLDFNVTTATTYYYRILVTTTNGGVSDYSSEATVVRA